MTKDLFSFQQSIAMAGWGVTEPVFESAAVAELRSAVDACADSGRGGVRNLLDDRPIAALAASPTLRRFASAILGDACFAVRALLFDKTPSTNWKVVWHQDLTIAAEQRLDVPGYGSER